MKKIIFLILFLTFFTVSIVAYADGSNVCTWAESKNWGAAAPGKLTRGILNTGLGWTNLFVQPFKEDTIMGGIGKGLSDFAMRTVQGIGEILLFWLPPAPHETMRDCVFYDWGVLERQPDIST